MFYIELTRVDEVEEPYTSKIWINLDLFDVLAPQVDGSTYLCNSDPEFPCIHVKESVEMIADRVGTKCRCIGDRET